MSTYQCVTGEGGSLGSCAVLWLLQFTKGSFSRRLCKAAAGPSEMLFMMNSDKKSWLEDIASPALVTVTSQNDGFSAMLKPVFSFCL